MDDEFSTRIVDIFDDVLSSLSRYYATSALCNAEYVRSVVRLLRKTATRLEEVLADYEE